MNKFFDIHRALSNFVNFQIHSIQSTSLSDIYTIDAFKCVDNALSPIRMDWVAIRIANHINIHTWL